MFEIFFDPTASATAEGEIGAYGPTLWITIQNWQSYSTFVESYTQSLPIRNGDKS